MENNEWNKGYEVGYKDGEKSRSADFMLAADLDQVEGIEDLLRQVRTAGRTAALTEVVEKVDLEVLLDHNNRDYMKGWNAALTDLKQSITSLQKEV